MFSNQGSDINYKLDHFTWPHLYLAIPKVPTKCLIKTTFNRDIRFGF